MAAAARKLPASVEDEESRSEAGDSKSDALKLSKRCKNNQLECRKDGGEGTRGKPKLRV